MAREMCQFPGCIERARTADIEHAAWNPEDTHSIFCDPHHSEIHRLREEAERKGQAYVESKPSCEYHDPFGGRPCGYNQSGNECFWCKLKICIGHVCRPFQYARDIIACPRCNAKSAIWDKTPDIPTLNDLRPRRII